MLRISRPAKFPFPSRAGRQAFGEFALVWREVRGSQGMGVVSNDLFYSCLFSIPYTFKPSR